MHKLLGLLLLAAALGAAPGLSADASSTLGGYALGGSVLGGLMGCVVATVPYLNDQQGFDYAVGAGVGAASGAVLGLLLGSLDLATHKSDEAQGPGLQDMRLSLAPDLKKGGGKVCLNASF
jgi:hypothetical protein